MKALVLSACIVIVSSASVSAQSAHVTTVELPARANQLPDRENPNASTIAAYTESSSLLPAVVSTEVKRLSEAKDVLKTIYSASFTRMAEQQGQIPQGILLNQGSISLPKLHQRHPNWLRKVDDKQYVAELPIIVDIGAELVISDNQILTLSNQKGSFLHNSGRLLITDAVVQGSAEQSQHSDFQPFIFSFGGSTTVVVNSTVRQLGFNETSSYGFSIRPATSAALQMLTGNERLQLARAPRLYVENSRFENLYIGIQADGVKDSAIKNSQVSHSQFDGIQILATASPMHISNNTIEQSKRHGLFLSDAVKASRVSDNQILLNGGAGIHIEQASANNVIAYNEIFQNATDGIGVYEANENRLYGNRIYQNGSHGIRLRSALSSQLQQNILLANQGSGVFIYAKDDETLGADLSASAVSEVIGGLMIGNQRGAITSEAPYSLLLGDLKLENNGRKAFRGRLELLEGAIVSATLTTNSAALIQFEED
ncbi:right-handed parallel beta-helix repeat-containing protein [Alteromonas flava]|uniref:right-handed parallel beta-helix repeat-containing protein n=1 Tax=Alteromonas flava TaxID=2048003 RepID=UPI000C287537|nr:right-handed parallel beta-helix repeat-containing protein [Alteromonas flava]